MKKDFLSISDLSCQEIDQLIQQALIMKQGDMRCLIPWKAVALLFEKPSLRTKVSFDLAVSQLGGHAIYLSPQEVGLGKRESVPDVARVLSRYVDCIVARTFSQETLRTLAEYSSVPVINALSDLEHPCQALSDFMTIYEKKSQLCGLTLAFVGDGNNVANSLLLAASQVGMNFRIATPPGYEIREEILSQGREFAGHSGSQIQVTNEPQEAVRGADVVYTDAWASMGEEAEREERLRAFAYYQVDEELLSMAKKDALFMHCLPAHRNEEVSAWLLDSPQSVVFDQAENRLHLQKALLVKVFLPGNSGVPNE
ncbi:MAG: ornithine carbamoyltransferase [Chloroflexota bacterium]|nr:ornithine carbamoyltransferase [Chloroflexota bacterium]